MLKNLLKKTNEGFTIIEVMIVLAIAGLILVVVLIAVPQLQRNQRNSARQNILSRISTELSSYAGNNSGAFPAQNSSEGAGNFGGATIDANGVTTDTASFAGKYIKGINVNDPSTGIPVTFTVGRTAPALGQVTYAIDSECGADGAISDANPGTQSRKFALAIGLEGNRAYCVDNK